MPEKVRVSPAPAPQLSTGAGDDQAALVFVPVDEAAAEVALVDEEDEESDDVEELDDVDSDLAGTLLLPEERLSVR